MMGPGDELPSFSVVDYIVFVLMLIGSLGIGAYHGLKGSDTTDDFLLAGRSMAPLPVAVSLTATWVSSISLLGFVGEVYGHGLELVWSLLGAMLGISVSCFVFLPVIFPLGLRSVNEYVSVRFKSDLLTKFMLLAQMLDVMLYLGVCLYAPTLALDAVTPLSFKAYILILGAVVTIYSSYGGMKAVVWTDVFQTAIVAVGLIGVSINSLVKAGGFGTLFSTASEHHRLNVFKGGLGLHERHTLINVLVLNFINYTSFYSFSQSVVQRIVTLKDLRSSRKVLYWNMLGIFWTYALLFFAGLCIFVVYANCDPIGLKHIAKNDQILPYYVMDQLGFLKGIPGVFVACLFSGTMSSISSHLNCAPTQLWVDFLSHIPKLNNASERVQTLINKFVTFLLGMIMIGLAFLASTLGGLVQASTTVRAMLVGPKMGVFLLGLCVPFCNKTGAIAGIVTSLIFSAWLGVGSHIHGCKPESLPLYTHGCDNSSMYNLSTSPATLAPASPTFNYDAANPEEKCEIEILPGFYGISYTYMAFLGCLVCMAVGTAVSFATGVERLENVDPDHMIHCLRKYVGGNHKPKKTAEGKPFIQEMSVLSSTKTSEKQNEAV